MPLASTIAGCQQVARQESRLGIPLLFGLDVVHGLRTTFPIPLGLSATWDVGLVDECASWSAEEAEAEGFNLTFAPMIDISSEHRWGRIGETFGDEPLLAGRLGAATVAGFQSSGRFAATAKHFCGYGLIHAERDYETHSVGLNTLHNVHLRPFRAAVAAGAHAVMVGFHDVDGVPMHANRALVRDLLKDQWGFSRGRRQRLGRDRPAGASGGGQRPAGRRPPSHAGRRRPGHGVRGLPGVSAGPDRLGGDRHRPAGRRRTPGAPAEAPGRTARPARRDPRARPRSVAPPRRPPPWRGRRRPPPSCC